VLAWYWWVLALDPVVQQAILCCMQAVLSTSRMLVVLVQALL
jgi:hypothetical protein